MLPYYSPWKSTVQIRSHRSFAILFCSTPSAVSVSAAGESGASNSCSLYSMEGESGHGREEVVDVEEGMRPIGPRWTEVRREVR